MSFILSASLFKGDRIIELPAYHLKNSLTLDGGYTGMPIFVWDSESHKVVDTKLCERRLVQGWICFGAAIIIRTSPGRFTSHTLILTLYHYLQFTTTFLYLSLSKLSIMSWQGDRYRP